jgi:hypothetical protein
MWKRTGGHRHLTVTNGAGPERFHVERAAAEERGRLALATSPAPAARESIAREIVLAPRPST